VAARARWVAVVAALVLTACQPNRFVSGWIPYWGATPGKTVIANADIASLYSDVSFLWYGTKADGTLPLLGNGSALAGAVATARAAGLPVIPTVFDSAPTGVMSGIIADPFARANHEQRIVDLVTSKGYDGIDLDYEVFAFGDGRSRWASIKPNWVAFVRELSALLHARGKVLSVTVPPVWDNGASGYTVYAQDQIAPFVDRLRLMVYDWSVGVAGPISPITWVKSVVAYSSKVVPVSKLQLGLPAYGRQWATQKYAPEVCPDGALFRDSITTREAPGLASANKVMPTRHASGELTFTWETKATGTRSLPVLPPTTTPTGTPIPSLVAPADTGSLSTAVRLGAPVTCTVKHVAYYPDEWTLKQSAKVALDRGWSGIIIWAMGYETSAVYRRLSELAPQRPNGFPAGLLDPPVAASGQVRLTGAAWHPEWDLPVSVRLVVGPAGGAAVVDKVVVANATRTLTPTGLGPFHGFDLTVPLLPGSYAVCASVVLWGGAAGPSMGCQPFTVPA